MLFRKNNDETPAIEETSVPRKRRLGRYLSVIVLALVLAGVFSVYLFAKKPAQGVIKTQSRPDELQKIGEDVPGTYIGEYVAISYRNTYALKSHDVSEKSEDVIVERAYFSESSAVSKKIGLTVRRFPTRNLEDIPDYKMREIASTRYKKVADFSTTDTRNGASFILAEENQFEKTFFLPFGDYVVILSVTAPSLPNEDLIKEADSIAKSVSWIKK